MLNSLDRVAASAAFISSLLECLVFIIRRLFAAPHDEAVSLVQGKAGESAVDVAESAKALLQEQVKRTWEELSSGQLKVRGKQAGTELAKTLMSLYKFRPGMRSGVSCLAIAQCLPDLFDVAWGVLSGEIQKSVASPTGAIPPLVPELLKQFSALFQKDTVPGDAANALVIEVVRAAINQCAALLQAEETQRDHVTSLVNILDTFGDIVFAEAQITKVSSARLWPRLNLLTCCVGCRRSGAELHSSATGCSAVTTNALSEASQGRSGLPVGVAQSS